MRLSSKLLLTQAPLAAALGASAIAAHGAACELGGLVAGLSLGALALGLAATLGLTRRLLRPIDSLGRAMRGLAAADLESRATATGDDEVAALVRALNELAARLRQHQRSSRGALALAREASRATLDSLSDPVLVFEPTGGVVSANAAARTLFPLRRAETLAQPLCGGEPALREATLRARDEVLAGRGAYQPRASEEAVRVTLGDGRGGTYLPRASPLHDTDGALVGVTVLLQDVTHLRRFALLDADLLERLGEALRAPLGAVRMAVHLCLEDVTGPLDERQTQLLLEARADCERLQRLADDLQELARQRAGASSPPARSASPEGEPGA